MSTFTGNLDSALSTGRVGADDEIKKRIEDLEREAQSLRGELSVDQVASSDRNNSGKPNRRNNNRSSNNNRSHNNNGKAREQPAPRDGDEKRQRRSDNSNNNNDSNNGDNDMDDDERPRGRVKWVSQEDDAKSVSRLIIGAAMPDAVVGFPVNLHSKYDLNTNTAMKGVAVAVLRINEDFGESHAGICCLPSFRDNRNEMTLTVHSLDVQPEMPVEGEEDTQVLSVARSTEYSVLAGAVAKNSRDGKMSILKAIGASAVFCGVRALATAREYLQSDGDEDIMVIPRFSKTILDGRDTETTVTELCVLPNRGEEDGDEDMEEGGFVEDN